MVIPESYFRQILQENDKLKRELQEPESCSVYMENAPYGCPSRAWFMRGGCESAVANGAQNQCRNVAQVQQSDSWFKSKLSRSSLFQWIQQTFGDDDYTYLTNLYPRKTQPTDDIKAKIWDKYYSHKWPTLYYKNFTKFVPEKERSALFEKFVIDGTKKDDAYMQINKLWMMWQPEYNKKIFSQISKAKKEGPLDLDNLQKKRTWAWENFDKSVHPVIKITPGNFPMTGTEKHMDIGGFKIKIIQDYELTKDLAYDQIDTHGPIMKQTFWIKSQAFGDINKTVGLEPGRTIPWLSLKEIMIIENAKENSHSNPYTVQFLIQYKPKTESGETMTNSSQSVDLTQIDFDSAKKQLNPTLAIGDNQT